MVCDGQGHDEIGSVERDGLVMRCIFSRRISHPQNLVRSSNSSFLYKEDIVLVYFTPV